MIDYYIQYNLNKSIQYARLLATIAGLSSYKRRYDISVIKCIPASAIRGLLPDHACQLQGFFVDEL
jgi:hypothetical protein